MKRGCVLLLLPLLLSVAFAQREEAKAETKEYGWLGVYTEGMSKAVKVALDLKAGALVSGVVDESPAEQAGLETGDIILKVDGQDIDDGMKLREVVRARPGKKVTVSLRRRGKTESKTVTLSSREKSKSSIWIDDESGLMEIPEDALRITRKVLKGVGPELEKSIQVKMLDRGEIADELEDLKEELEDLQEQLQELREQLGKKATKE